MDLIGPKRVKVQKPSVLILGNKNITDPERVKLQQPGVFNPRK